MWSDYSIYSPFLIGMYVYLIDIDMISFLDRDSRWGIGGGGGGVESCLLVFDLDIINI